MGSRFWSYDGETFEFHDTPREAEIVADAALDNCRDESADGGWPDRLCPVPPMSIVLAVRPGADDAELASSLGSD